MEFQKEIPGREKDQPTPGAHKASQKWKLSSISGKEVLPPPGGLGCAGLSRHNLLDRY